MNSNEKCVTGLQAPLNVTYEYSPGKLALSKRTLLMGHLFNREWPRPWGISCAVFLLKLQVKSPPLFLFQGWLIDGFGTENMASVEDGC